MAQLQKISTRLIVPIFLVTVFFSALLYVVAGHLIGKLVTYNLERLGQSKMVDITSSEKRISQAMLAQAALFSKQQAVLAAYEMAYKGNIESADDPHLEAARRQLRDHFAAIERRCSMARQPCAPKRLLRITNASSVNGISAAMARRCMIAPISRKSASTTPRYISTPSRSQS